MLSIYSDEYFMKEAFKEAQKAFDEGEVPVGAVVVANKRILAKAHNQTELLKDVTAHAEIIAMTGAANAIGAKYLPDCTLYVTLEPCVMCAGASYWSQIGKIVVGASDKKRGFSQVGTNLLHPKTEITWGVLEHQCSEILSDFFTQLRNE